MSTWRLQAFAYLYTIGAQRLRLCDYAGDKLLLVEAAATLPLAMPPILPAIYTPKPCSTRSDTVLVTMLSFAQLRFRYLIMERAGDSEVSHSP